MLALALLAPVAHAEGNPPSAECEGYAYYFKIQTPENGVYTSATPGVETNWAGQEITISDAADGNQEFNWASTEIVSQVVVKFGNDSVTLTAGLPGTSGSVDNDDQNGISHVTWCGNPPVTTTTTDETTTTTTDETTTTTTDETTTTTTEETTTTTTDETTTTTTTSFTQTVGALTDPPPTVTLPPTDAFGSPAQPSSDGTWRLLLIAMAGLLAAVLILTPAKVRNRR